MFDEKRFPEIDAALKVTGRCVKQGGLDQNCSGSGMKNPFGPSVFSAVFWSNKATWTDGEVIPLLWLLRVRGHSGMEDAFY